MSSREHSARQVVKKSAKGESGRGSGGKHDLIEAAIEEFAEVGYAGATTASIARRAGVTQPLVHHHFGSKEGLWLEVVDQLFGELERDLEAARAAVRDAPRAARVRELLRTLVRFSGRNPLLARLVRTEGGHGGEGFTQMYSRWLRSLVQLFRDEISAGVADGTLRAFEPGFLYFTIVGACVEGFAQPKLARRAFHLEMDQPAVIDRYADVLADVLLHGMLAKHR
jgi:AcrR family transcriptional regulator